MVEEVCIVVLWQTRVLSTKELKGYDDFGQGAKNG